MGRLPMVRIRPIADIRESWLGRQMSEAEVIEALDQAPLPAAAWQQVAFELINRVGFNDADALQMLHDYAEGRLTGGASTPAAAAIIAKRRDPTLVEYERSKFYLLGCLLPSPQPLDGYGAEYLFKWGGDLGLGEAAVVAALRRAMSS